MSEEYLFERYFAGKDHEKSLHKIAYRADNFKILTGFKMVLLLLLKARKSETANWTEKECHYSG